MASLLGTTQSARIGRVHFDRCELDQLLRLYGRMVAAGVWRDYAIDSLSDAAVFSVFKRASEAPMYCIEKRPALMHKQGAYAVYTGQGFVMKRGRDLVVVLRVLDRPRLAGASD